MGRFVYIRGQCAMKFFFIGFILSVLAGRFLAGQVYLLPPVDAAWPVWAAELSTWLFVGLIGYKNQRQYSLTAAIQQMSAVCFAGAAYFNAAALAVRYHGWFSFDWSTVDLSAKLQMMTTCILTMLSLTNYFLGKASVWQIKSEKKGDGLCSK